MLQIPTQSAHSFILARKFEFHAVYSVWASLKSEVLSVLHRHKECMALLGRKGSWGCCFLPELSRSLSPAILYCAVCFWHRHPTPEVPEDYCCYYRTLLVIAIVKFSKLLLRHSPSIFYADLCPRV